MRRRWIGFAVIALLTGGPVAADPPQRPSPIAGIVAQAASRAGIPEAWIWSVMRVESGGDLHAVSRAGAMGLMQLMPATWSDLRTRLALGDDPFDPHDNVLAGATYLRAMHDRYGEPGFLAAYNAGPARYEEYLLRHRPLPAETITMSDGLRRSSAPARFPIPWPGPARRCSSAVRRTDWCPLSGTPAAK
ncbi:lytic transglycosylase domain-containing protein [Sphingomonas oryzagri]